MFERIDFMNNGLDCERVTVDGKRFYQTEDGKRYPSITTVIGWSGREKIKQWRARVGEKKANAISSQAARRGTKVHKMCEDYVNNKPNFLDGHMPSDVENFTAIKPDIDKLIGGDYAQEYFMYSDHLRIAGTADCIAMVNGKASIVDFKTSKKSLVKGGYKLPKYFAQCAGYAVMFEERTGIPVSQLVIIAAVDEKLELFEHDQAEVYIEKRDDYIDSLKDMIHNYKKDNNLL